MRSAFLSFLTACPLLVCAGTNGFLSTVAEFSSTNSYTGHQLRPFRLEGRCLATDANGLILEDATGRTVLHLANDSHVPTSGARVLVTGSACLGWLGDLYNDISQRGADVQSPETPSNAVPPVAFAETTVAELSRETRDLQFVRFRGTVVDVFQDDIDYRNVFALVRDGDATLTLGLNREQLQPETLAALVDARIEVAGCLFQNSTGRRIYLGAQVRLTSVGSLRILEPAPDPFAAPSVFELHSTSPKAISAAGRVSAVGIVQAVRRDGRIILYVGKGRIANVSLALQAKSPPVGSRIRAVGYPRTDLYHVNLIRAIWRPETNRLPAQTAIFDSDPTQLLGDPVGRVAPEPQLHGQLVRLRGVIRRVNEADDQPTLLEANGRTITLETRGPDALPDGLTDGCTVEATGIWALDVDNWQPESIVPRISGAALVIRRPDDIRILARPPWWTPRRLLVVLAALLAVLAGIAVWNRVLNRLVVRRSRELRREELAHFAATQRLDERTRLAAELHDALSQNLSAVACQVNVAKSVAPREGEVRTLLETAERMLLSTRTELTRCLFDLKGPALGERDFAKAIRQTLTTLDLPDDMSVDVSVRRSRFDDTTAHAVLCIIRELAANALRHGHATSLAIAGAETDGIAEFSVTDNGCGFDPAHRPGAADGHFGLDGITDRVRRLGGTLDITSAPGKGTCAVIRIRP